MGKFQLFNLSVYIGFSKQFIPQFIKETVDLYPETQIGVQGNDLVPAMIGRFSYYVTEIIGDQLGCQKVSKILVGFGLGCVIGICKRLKGLDTWTWAAEWGMLSLISLVDTVMRNEREGAKNEIIEAKELLKLFLPMLHAAACYSFKANRCGASLRAYCCYGAGVALLNQVVDDYLSRNKKEWLSSCYTPNLLKKLMESKFFEVGYECLKTYLIGRLMNGFVYFPAGRAVHVDRKVEILGILGMHAAKWGLNAVFPPK